MLTDLITGLSAIMPTTYGSWGTGNAQPLPYLIVFDTGPDDFYADDAHYLKRGTYRVEFYFEQKDPTVETQIESFFDADEIDWACDGDVYIETDKMFERIYYIEKGE